MRLRKNGISRPKGSDFVVAMAKEKTNLTDGAKDDCGQRVNVKIALALTVALVSPVFSANQRCDAADFRHAKKIVVPASNIPRRYDYDTSSGRESGLPAGYETTPTAASTTYSSGSANYNAAPKSGLVPPPPPVTPSLLPSSMAGDVPPPPVAPPIVSQGSSGSSGKYQTTSGDPTRATGVDRHSGNTKAYKLGAETSTVSHVTAHADTLVKEGKLQEAQELLEKYEKIYPKNAAINSKLSQVSLDRAKYYVRHDNYVEGAKQARIALAHNSSNTEAKHVLEQVLRHHGVEPNHSLSRVKLGDVLFSQGKLKEARVEYDAAIKADHSTAAYIGLGNIALRENKLKEAKAHYQLALEKEPESSVALRQLGVVRYKLKDVVGANTDLSRALVINQDDKQAGQTLVELWQRQVSMHPRDANSHLGLARAYQLSGDLKSAQNAYRTVVSIDPNHPNLPAARQSFKLALARQEAQKTYEAAKTLDASGAVPEAYNKASESVALSPGDVKFRLYQAELAERLGNAPEAKHLYMEILRQDPKNLVAAQKIKSLTELLTGNDTAQSLRGPIGMMSKEGLQAQAGALDAAAGSLVQGATSGALTGSPPLGSALGTPMMSRLEGPALATLPAAPGALKGPIPTADPVQNMSGFLGSLRNYMIQQKKDLQKQEDTILETLNPKTKPADSASSLSKLAELPPSPTLDLPKNLISSAEVQKAIAAAGGNASSSGSNIGALATGATLGAAGAAASTFTAPRGATSASDISRLLAGDGTAGGALSGGALNSSALNSALSSLPINIPASAPTLSNSLPPIDSSALGSQSYSTQTAVNDSLLSAPVRRSESVLKVAEAPEVMPPVAPSRFGLSKPVGAIPIAAAPAGIDVAGLAAHAQNLSPQALSGIAQSLGMDPAALSAVAGQAMQQAPQLINAAPGLINQGLAKIKPEDIDKYSKMLKEHVAKQQALTTKTSKPSIPSTPSKTSTAVASKETATTKVAPSAVKKVEMAKADPKATKATSAKLASAGKPGTSSKAAPPTAGKETNPGGKPQIATNSATGTPAGTSTQTASPAVSVPAAAMAAEPPSTQGQLSQEPVSEEPNTKTPAQTTFTHPPLGEEPSTPQAAVTHPPLGEEPNAQAPETSSVPADHVQRVASLEAQNKDLSSQLEDTRKELQMLRESMFNSSLKDAKKMNMAKEAKTEKVKTPRAPKTRDHSASSDSSANAVETPQAKAAPLTVPTTSGFNSGFAQSSAANAFSPNATSAATSALASLPTASIPGFASPASPIVNLELAGVNVKSKGVRLNVVLRNGTGHELSIPASTKAVVRMVGVPDQLAEVKFPVKTVDAGQETRGYISVSGHRLDPSADVFIPKLVSTASGARDVHLTVPISALSAQPPQ